MKKILPVIFIIFFCISVKAQLNYVEHSGNLQSKKETIARKIEEQRKKGIKDTELEKAYIRLNEKLSKPQHTLHGNGNFERMVSPPSQILSGCTNPGFENGTTSNWTFKSGDNTGNFLPCPNCIYNSTGIINQVVHANSTATVDAGNCSIINPIPCNNGIDAYGGFPWLPLLL